MTQAVGEDDESSHTSLLGQALSSARFPTHGTMPSMPGGTCDLGRGARALLHYPCQLHVRGRQPTRAQGPRGTWLDVQDLADLRGGSLEAH